MEFKLMGISERWWDCSRFSGLWRIVGFSDTKKKYRTLKARLGLQTLLALRVSLDNFGRVRQLVFSDFPSFCFQ
ncbi:hypothetical protein RhiirA5_444034 [Rhizophagus irregularis]|uniref:Uncharacterized protein n=1 Tax=Rhizophagus irregularis TaxID=588596 RepID=A0A2N0NDL2_9GLOM|nr:hypothetical protein RhiirA5_444034 [Rhizophagus irregularis]